MIKLKLDSGNNIPNYKNLCNDDVFTLIGSENTLDKRLVA